MGTVFGYTTPMCGRYRLTAKERYIAEHFNVDEEEVQWSPRYNIAPTQQVPVIRQDRQKPQRHFSLMRWGLIPSFANDASIGNRTINAMSETAAEKPAFRDAIKRHRCLVPADGFYEWKRLGARDKQPYNIGLQDDGIFAFAGLWDRWRQPSGEWLESCTILTTSANAVTRDVHGRMPVILRPEDYDDWLDPGISDARRVQELLKPFAGAMRKYPVGARVSNPANDDSECATETLALESSTPTLF